MEGDEHVCAGCLGYHTPEESWPGGKLPPNVEGVTKYEFNTIQS